VVLKEMRGVVGSKVAFPVLALVVLAIAGCRTGDDAAFWARCTPTASA
jgi:hypothetical protein